MNLIDWLAGLDPRVLIAGILVLGALIAIPLEVAAVRRLGRLQLVSGTMCLLSGAVFALLAAGIALVAANLYSYARLTKEQEAARVTIRQLGERHFVASIQARAAPARHFELRGDEWQIDARVLKWKPMGTLLGLDTIYRFERLSGRYGDIALERRGPRTVHALSEDTGLDFWTVVRQYHDWLPLADALYGSAAYVPLAESAEYTVAVSNTGLLVRPANDAAKKALGGWK